MLYEYTMVNNVSIFLRMTVLRSMNHFPRDGITQTREQLSKFPSSRVGGSAWQRHWLQKIWNANTMSCLKTSDTSLWLKHIKSWFSPICCHFAGHPSHFGQTQVRRPLVKLRGSGYADVQKLRVPQAIGFRIGNNQCVLDIIGWFWRTPNSGNLQP